jgi:hypothetical protein
MARMHSRPYLLAVLVSTCWLASLRIASATLDVFAIDPTQSTMTASASSSFGAVVEQAPGSLTTTLSGSVNVDTDLFTTLSFPGGSSITPDINGDWMPAAGGLSGTQPAQFGAIIDPGNINIYWASHDNLFDVTTSSHGSLPISGGTFDSSLSTFTLVNSIADYSSSFGHGTLTTTNYQAPNQLGGGTLSVSGNVATLTIPIQITVDQTVPNGQEHTVLAGQVVATDTFVPGDVNFDGIVNGQDVATIASNWLATGVGIPGDANGDGIVNGQDIALIASNWLQTGGGAGAARVPEPSTIVLAALAGLALLARRLWRG